MSVVSTENLIYRCKYFVSTQIVVGVALQWVCFNIVQNVTRDVKAMQTIQEECEQQVAEKKEEIAEVTSDIHHSNFLVFYKNRFLFEINN